MRTTLTILVLSLLSLALGAVRAAPAFGCSCIEMQVQDAIDATTPAAFVGIAVAVEDLGDGGRLPNGDWLAPMQWTFEVETVLAGDLPDVLVVGSGRDGGDCGYDFSAAGRIGVVANGQPGNLTTDICGGVWSADALLAAHGPGTSPFAASPPERSEPGDEGIPMWPIVFGGVALTIAASAVLWRRFDQI